MQHLSRERASWRPWLLVALLGSLLLAALSSASAQAAVRADATYIVQLRSGVSIATGDALVRADGGRVTQELPIIDGLAAKLGGGSLAAVRGDARVKAVTADHGVAPQAYDMRQIAAAYPAAVAADKAWSSPAGQYTGKGVGVAVIDTGIAGDMPDFQGADGNSRVIANVVTNPNAVTYGDSYGHGTHVAGILAGDGTQRDPGDPLRGQYVGIAPQANLISVKVSDELGNATVLDVINGLQFVVDHQSDLNIRVVNLSLESNSAGSYKTDPLDAAVESAWFHGIVVVAAAGNLGNAPDAVSYAPGNDPFVISVGAVDDQGTKPSPDDAPASWSSVGTTEDGFAKPEVMAPGAHIVSTLAAGSAFTTLCPACIVGGQYIRAGGTSMAAPVVSGVAALMLQRHPDWTPNQIKATLVGTARDVPASVAGEVNAGAAVGAPTPKQDHMNAGVQPNSLVDTSTGAIDYTRSSWSRSSWSSASDPLTAGFARSSWSCVCGGTTGGQIDPTRSSWSRSSWSSKWDF
jgi:serine protease AprX